MALKEKIYLHKTAPPPIFTLTPVCEYLLFTFLSICPSNRHTSLVQPTLAVGVGGVGGGFTIRRPPTMAEILGFVGAKLKKSVPPPAPSCHSVHPCDHPASLVFPTLRTTHDASAHRLACHKGLTDILSTQ